MDPVFTLQWPEFLLATRLQKAFPKSQGILFANPCLAPGKGLRPGSYQEPSERNLSGCHDSNQSLSGLCPKPPKKTSTKRHRFHTWFNRFKVPKEANFFLLFGLYAPDASRTKKISRQWYRDCTLLFTQQEMKNFMSSCRTRGGKPDRMFGFGFDDERRVAQTRGDRDRQLTDYTRFLLSRRISLLKTALRA